MEAHTFGLPYQPGSGESLQQWLQKIEYCLVRQKMIAKETLENTIRMRRAVTAAERRQDGSSMFATDLLRHWRDAPDWQSRGLQAAQQVQTHMNSGVCCLPSCLCFLAAVGMAKSGMKRWEKEEAEEAAQEAQWAEYEEPAEQADE